MLSQGGAIFVNLKLSDGKHLIEGKKVTGFTTKGEIELTVLDEIKVSPTPCPPPHAF
jgi:hypothetical protein